MRRTWKTKRSEGDDEGAVSFDTTHGSGAVTICVILNNQSYGAVLNARALKRIVDRVVADALRKPPKEKKR